MFCGTGLKPVCQTTSTIPSATVVLSSNQNKASRSHDQFLPTPFQTVSPSPISHYEVSKTVPLSYKGAYAQELDRLIKDVYSEVEVPFQPFRNQTTIPDWIFLQTPQYQGDGGVPWACQLHAFKTFIFV